MWIHWLDAPASSTMVAHSVRVPPCSLGLNGLVTRSSPRKQPVGQEAMCRSSSFVLNSHPPIGPDLGLSAAKTKIQSLSHLRFHSILLRPNAPNHLVITTTTTIPSTSPLVRLASDCHFGQDRYAGTLTHVAHVDLLFVDKPSVIAFTLTPKVGSATLAPNWNSYPELPRAPRP